MGNVRRFPEKFVDLVPLKFPDKKNASTEKKLSSKKSQKKLVTWNPKESVNTSPNWFLFLSQPKNALISQKKYVLVPEPTQERSKSQLPRNGVTYQLLNLVWLKPISERFRCIAHFNNTFCLSNFLFGYLYMLVMYSKMMPTIILN